MMRVSVYIMVLLLIASTCSALVEKSYAYQTKIIHPYETNPAPVKPVVKKSSTPLKVLASSSSIAASATAGKKAVFKSATFNEYEPKSLTLSKRLCPDGGVPKQVLIPGVKRSHALTTECQKSSYIISNGLSTFPDRESGWQLYDRFRSPLYNARING